MIIPCKMPSVFRSVTALAAASPPRASLLVLQQADGLELQLVRSSCSGTLAARIEEIDPVAVAGSVGGRGVGGRRCAWLCAVG